MTTEQETEQETIQEFIDRNNVKATFLEMKSNPNMLEDPKNKMYHFEVIIKQDCDTMTTYYSMGCAHNKRKRRKGVNPESHSHEYYQLADYKDDKNLRLSSELVIKYFVPTVPKCCDILNCLVMDADVLNYPTYEEWGLEFGYDEDSRKGEKIYRDCIQNALKLRNLFGTKLFNEIMECERL